MGSHLRDLSSLSPGCKSSTYEACHPVGSTLARTTVPCVLRFGMGNLDKSGPLLLAID